MKAKEHLIAARKIIETPEKWWRGQRKPKPGQRCIYGAIHAVEDCVARPAVYRRLQKVVGVERLNEWNDAPGRKHAEVLAAFDKAIALRR